MTSSRHARARSRTWTSDGNRLAVRDHRARQRLRRRAQQPRRRASGAAWPSSWRSPRSSSRRCARVSARLADEEYAAAQERIVPGTGADYRRPQPTAGRDRAPGPAGARRKRPPRSRCGWPSGWRPRKSANSCLFSHVPLARSLPDDPERSWQLMRRLARAANEWVSVDELATLYAQGILRERFRWAELEQLVYSADKWERRLVGATIARLPFELPKHRRAELATSPGLTIIKSLIGDVGAGRAEGALLGPPKLERGRSTGRNRRSCATKLKSPRAQTTEIGPGSCATR